MGVLDLDAAENQLASLDQRMDVVADANMNHGRDVSVHDGQAKEISGSDPGPSMSIRWGTCA
jgi:hypothetical protein